SAGEKKLALDKSLGTAEGQAQQNKGEAQTQLLQNYLFRVAGTNRSLNEQIVFTGNVIASVNQTFFKQTTNGPTGDGIAHSPTLPAEPDPLRVRSGNSRITGRALIGDRREIEI